MTRRSKVQLGCAVVGFAVAVLSLAAVDDEARAQGTPARRSAAALPTGDQIITRYEQALGGAAALARVTTRTTKTRRIVDLGTPSDHLLVRHSKRGPGGAPMSIMNHGDLTGQFMYWLNGCDGKTGWQRGQKDSIEDADTLTGGICEHEQAFYGYFVLDAARMRKNFQRLEVRGVYKIVPTEVGAFGELAGGKGADLVPAGARDTYLVYGVPAGKDAPVWLFFDVQTGLLLRRGETGEGSTPVPPGDSPRVTDFLQYRDVGDGTKMPFQFVTFGGPNRTRGVHVEVTDNAPIDDKVFIKPKVGSRQDKGLS
jgi:hypothetical protein